MEETENRIEADSGERSPKRWKEIQPVDIRRAAMDLLARREHSRLELQQKLVRRFGRQHKSIDGGINGAIEGATEGSIEGAIDEAVETLTEEGLQSDTRLAEAFIRARANKGQGPVKIKMELKKKGVADDLIAIAFEASEIDWGALVNQVAHRKFDDIDSLLADMKGRGRLSRFLQQRGFTYEQISQIG